MGGSAWVCLHRQLSCLASFRGGRREEVERRVYGGGSLRE